MRFAKELPSLKMFPRFETFQKYGKHLKDAIDEH